ncbi:unnamed protein product [Haemonchus placei]|uniref:Uncharacterized protein n=1 Tax=Haemonchus placei TaxID=6290 RepID=A0A3P7Y4D3_HAEPC|nr:unnamed protein product [Haemonchus placei]
MQYLSRPFPKTKCPVFIESPYSSTQALNRFEMQQIKKFPTVMSSVLSAFSGHEFTDTSSPEPSIAAGSSSVHEYSTPFSTWEIVPKSRTVPASVRQFNTLISPEEHVTRKFPFRTHFSDSACSTPFSTHTGETGGNRRNSIANICLITS